MIVYNDVVFVHSASAVHQTSRELTDVVVTMTGQDLQAVCAHLERGISLRARRLHRFIVRRRCGGVRRRQGRQRVGGFVPARRLVSSQQALSALLRACAGMKLTTSEPHAWGAGCASFHLATDVHPCFHACSVHD